MSFYHVDKAVGTRLLILVNLVYDQEHNTHQEGQSTHHQQSHLKETDDSCVRSPQICHDHEITFLRLFPLYIAQKEADT